VVVDPGGLFGKRLEIGGTHIELPAFVGVGGLEAHDGLLDGQRPLVIAPRGQIPVHGALLQQRLGRHDPSLGGVDPIVLEEPDRLGRREMMALGIARPHLQRRNEFTVALQLGWGHDAGHAIVGATQRPRPGLCAQRPINRRGGHAVDGCRLLHQLFALGPRGGTQLELLAQSHQRLFRQWLTDHARASCASSGLHLLTDQLDGVFQILERWSAIATRRL
jgi:hypothetical protein